MHSKRNVLRLHIRYNTYVHYDTNCSTLYGSAISVKLYFCYNVRLWFNIGGNYD